jgi:hypothetical protein
VIGLALLCMAVACSFEDSAARCQLDSECGSDKVCYDGFCIPGTPGSTANPQLGSDAGTPTSPRGGRGGSLSGGTGGTGGTGNTGGKGGTSGKGNTGPGTADAGMNTIPRDAAVGGECGRDGEERPCLVNPDDTTSAEACNRGMQACIDGAWSACAPQPMPEAESCNGRDDDCNGEVDDLRETCYPDGQAGCSQGSDGRWTCAGTCGTGTRTCSNGMLSECDGATVPVEEACTPENMVARNEDCDDMTDEGCDCRSGETRTCSSGRTDQMNVGKCKAGMQTCENGAFGACTGEVNAETETCANPNVDDDCNGTVDDVATVGSRCQVMDAQGPCATGMLRCSGSSGPTCVSTTMPGTETCNNIDDDCNGRVDEDFNLRGDSQNCGACGMRCGAGTTCCNSRCIDQTDDDAHCGACGNRCPDRTRCRNSMCVSDGMPMAGMPSGGAGTGGMSGSPAGGAGSPGSSGTGGSAPPACAPACAEGQTCCNGTCVNLETDRNNCNACGNVCAGADDGCCDGTCASLLDGTNCGVCGRDCSLLGDGEITCSCTKSEEGEIACRGPVLGLCL